METRLRREGHVTREVETGVIPHMPGIAGSPPSPFPQQPEEARNLWRECGAGDAVITALPTSCQFGASGLQTSVQVDFCGRGRL